MCGIAGLVMPLAAAGRADDALRAMAGRIAHRGPDDAGFLGATTRDGRHRVGLAHRRLSIIDLATGHQPLGNEDGSVQIVFNGEIYNFAVLRDELIAAGHGFSTASDTETIVHAWEQWGPACLDRLEGMFAFALWDARAQSLFLARDRFGKKPLFVAEHAGGLLFGSEIKAVLAWPGMPVQLDETALWDYFQCRYVPGPRTLFRGVRKLQPGGWLRWQDGRTTEGRYWEPPDAQARQPAPPPADPVRGFLAELDRSVSQRMVSDVPFGAFLSGGLDSSAVVALMARHSGLPVRTFSVGFSESEYSELPHAALVARRFKTEHHELAIAARDLADHLPAMAAFRDAPVAETADVPIYLLSKLARTSVKMVLTGEGSDEILAGYPKHRAERWAATWQRAPAALRRGLVEPAVRALPYRFHRLQTLAATLGLEDFDARMKRWFGALAPDERARLVAWPPEPAAEVPLRPAPGNTALRSILHFDQTSWLPDNLLERGDRMTMAASIEARMPFMDHRLAAFVSALPDDCRIRGGSTKWLLREAAAELLPPEILQRPKVGFRVPVNLWFRGHLRELLHDSLTGPASRTAGWYRRPALQQVLDEHDRGRRNHEKLLWSLLNLEIWVRASLEPAQAAAAGPGAGGLRVAGAMHDPA